MTAAATTKETPLPAWQTLLIDFGPVIAFYAAYRFDGIMSATVAVTVAAVVAALVSWRLTGKVSVALMVTTGLAVVFGALTIALDDESFVKLKSTLVNALLASVLLGGLPFRRPLLKPVLAPRFPPMQERGWFILSRNFGLFFAAMALINEAVWRTQSTETWVNYNLWGDMLLTFLFGMSQMPVMERYADAPTSGAEKAELIPPQI